MIGTVLAAVAGITAGGWSITFEAQSQRMAVASPDAEVALSGGLSFTSGGKDWRVAAPRDAVSSRLALVDPNDNVQGYLSFQADGGRLRILAYHRTAQAYEGVLTYAGETRFRPDAFACRAQPSPNDQVLRLASGDADSLLNYSLFSRAGDLALVFRAAGGVRLRAKGEAGHGFSLTGRIHEASEATFSIGVERDYYKSRYVPYYKPVDKKRCPRPPTGWMSWNVYFDTATAEDNLAEARLGKKYLQPFGLEFWSIESWQGNSDRLPVSKFYNMNLECNETQFPLGMKRLADDIRALGFRPGIWMAPFGTGSDAFYQAHKEWFLHRKDGSPISCWNGKYTLDPTVDEAVAHLRKIFDTASHEWGYEYFKIDGMSGRNHGYCAHLYERPEIKACFRHPECRDPFERCVRAFREGIGPDRVFLACQGHFTGPETASADASRTGADIVSPNCPVTWRNIMGQARCTLNQIFAHNIVFYADPDTLLVNDALDMEQARVTTTIVSLPGQMMFSGDKLAELKPERIRLLQQTLPVADVHPVALYPYFRDLPVWDLAVTRPFISYHVVALFNWEDKPKPIHVSMDDIGEPRDRRFVAYEFWTGSYLGETSFGVTMEVPARSVRLLAIHPVAPHPQYLSSDRHVTQGAVELKALAWKDLTLTSTVEVIGGFPMTVRYRVPAHFHLASCQVPDSVTAKTVMESPEVLAVTLETLATRDVAVSLKFDWRL
ncbi:MAG: alpha-galactosidase [Kiritimatiellae bacterium]|nr:alpha-galactosidase [Kiritimatiellia bacterium]